MLSPGGGQVGALYVFDENYWKRRCVEKLGWQNCQIAEHGLTWKQLFFEVSTEAHRLRWRPPQLLRLRSCRRKMLASNLVATSRLAFSGSWPGLARGQCIKTTRNAHAAPRPR